MTENFFNGLWCITITGMPGSGKTTVARELVNGFSKEGVNAVFIEDMGGMIEWAHDPKNIEAGLVLVKKIARS